MVRFLEYKFTLPFDATSIIVRTSIRHSPTFLRTDTGALYVKSSSGSWVLK